MGKAAKKGYDESNLSLIPLEVDSYMLPKWNHFLYLPFFLFLLSEVFKMEWEERNDKELDRIKSNKHKHSSASLRICFKPSEVQPPPPKKKESNQRKQMKTRENKIN